VQAAVNSDATEALPARSVVTRKPQAALSLAPALRKLVRDTGSSYFQVMREYFRLSLGPGQLTFPEYFQLRSIGCEFPATAESKAFVGIRTARKIWLQANFRAEFLELLGNKVAGIALFAAYGLPTIPTLAMFSTRAGVAAPSLLPDADALRSFLTDETHYPLFGKPIGGTQSLGSSSLVRYRRADDHLVDIAGDAIPLDDFIADLTTYYGGGYLFQRRVVPHAAVRDICGDRLATLRILTIFAEGKPRILRACWKIPAGKNGADNFWRPGNLLAQFDRDTGRIHRVIRRTADGIEEVSHHPDSGRPLLGTRVPNWHAASEAAIEAAKVVPQVGMIGWDVAAVDTGAVIVESNCTPNLMLHQLADRRGILDAELLSFLAERRRMAADWRKELKRRLIETAVVELTHQ